MFKIILLTAVFTTLVKGAELPNYIKKCKLSDEKLNECYTRHANEAIPRIVKGDSDFKLINMSPIVIPMVDLGTGPNLQMHLNSVTTDNLKNVKIIKSNFDAKGQKLEIESTLDVLEVLSDYFIKGRILVLPINGEGKSNITLVGNKLIYNAELGVRTVGNEKFYHIDKAETKLIPERVYFHFDNLFGGDPNLGKQMNDFVDKNWKDFFEELKPAIQKTMETTVTNTYNVYFSKVPIDKLFDD